METPVQPVSEKELAAAQSGPATFVNRFLITVASVVRITFAEQDPTFPGILNFRTAVALSHADAIALAHVLSQLLKPIEDQLDAAVAAQPAPQPAENPHG